MAKLKGLGRGLDSLLASGDAGGDDKLTTLDITQIRPGRYQPRRVMGEDELRELAESIRAQGLIQPVIVRELGLSDYELIAGERRWRACQLAGLTEIPAVIKAVNDEAALAMGISAAAQADGLNTTGFENPLSRTARGRGFQPAEKGPSALSPAPAKGGHVRLCTLPPLSGLASRI